VDFARPQLQDGRGDRAFEACRRTASASVSSRSRSSSVPSAPRERDLDLRAAKSDAECRLLRPS